MFLVLQIKTNQQFHKLEKLVQPQLLDSNCYINPLSFLVENFKNVTIGWVHKVHPLHHNCNKVSQDIQGYLTNHWTELTDTTANK